MNPLNFMLAMGEVIATDQELQAWCQEIFAKPLTLFVGVDLENPPEVADYPVCALLDLVEKKGESLHNQVFSLDFSVAVYDEELKIDGNMRIYSGLPKAAELKSLVEAAILRADVGLLSVNFTDSEGLMALAPIFVGFSTAECELIKSSRNALRR